jgi:hypothetical protein
MPTGLLLQDDEYLRGAFRDRGGAVKHLLAYGAALDDATNDATAVQASVDDAAAGVPVLFPGDGVARLVVGATSDFTFSNPADRPVHRAVALARSDLTLLGHGGLIRTYGFTAAAGTEYQYAFATDKNVVAGTLKRIHLEGFGFEVAQDGSPGLNRRGLFLVGVEGLRLVHLHSFSGAERNLYFAHIHNCDHVNIHGLRLVDTTAGINFRFCRGVHLSDHVHDNFSEALDFDGVNWDIHATNLTFRGNGVRTAGQCLDLNSVVSATFEGITATDAGNFVVINYKHTTQPNYADYVAGVTPTEMSPSRDITMRSVRLERMGSAAGAPVFIGNDWGTLAIPALPHPGYPPVHDILLEDWVMRDTGYVLIRESGELELRDFKMFGTLNDAPFYAIHAYSQYATPDQVAWSDLRLTLRRVEMNGTSRGAVRVAAPSKLVIDGLKIRNADSTASGEAELLVRDLEVRGAAVEIDGLDVVGDVVLNGGTTAGLPYSLFWGPNNRITGTLTLQGNVHDVIVGRTVTVPIGDVAATGTVNRVLFRATRACRIARAWHVVTANVTGSGTNNRSVLWRRYSAGVTTTNIASPNTIPGWTAFVPNSAGFAVNETDADLAAGDVLAISITHSGTGAALSGLSVAFEVLEYGP